MTYLGPEEVWSGGQTGADLGGLKGARDAGVRTGGWMPRGYRTEDGRRPDIAKEFGLKEHDSASYPPRTQMNAWETDCTVWFGRTGSAGCRCTLGALREKRKLLIVVPYKNNPLTWDLHAHSEGELLAEQIAQHKPRRLNVAGNRESTNPGIERFTRLAIFTALSGLLRGDYRYD